MRKFSFERSKAWQAAADLAVAVYRLLERLPAIERYGLESQLRRSIHSVPSNIAEGSGRATGRDQAHYSTIAYGSLVESLNHLLLAERHGYLSAADIDPLRPQFSKVATHLSALRRYQLKSDGLNAQLAQEPPPDDYATYPNDYVLPPLD